MITDSSRSNFLNQFDQANRNSSKNPLTVESRQIQTNYKDKLNENIYNNYTN